MGKNIASVLAVSKKAWGLTWWARLIAMLGLAHSQPIVDEHGEFKNLGAQ